MSRTTVARTVAGLFMLFGVLGFAPTAHAQQQGVGVEPTVADVGCATWTGTTGDYTCPLTRAPSGDPVENDLQFFEYMAVFDAVGTVYEHVPGFEYEGYVGSQQSSVDYNTGVVTAFLYVYNSQWGRYNVVRSRKFYPDLCGWCAAPAGFEDSTTYLGYGLYNH